MAAPNLIDKEWKWFRQLALINLAFEPDNETLIKDLEVIDEASRRDDPVPVYQRFADFFLPERAGMDARDVRYLGLDPKEKAMVQEIQKKMIEWQEESGYEVKNPIKRK